MFVPNFTLDELRIKPEPAPPVMKFCSPPFSNVASLPFAVMTLDCLAIFTQPRRAAMSSRGIGWLTIDACALVVVRVMKSNVKLFWRTSLPFAWTPPMVAGHPMPAL